MGSPLSPIVADIVLQDIETKALNILRFKPTFYLRYVDDILFAVPNSETNYVLEVFNSLQNKLQFTLDVGINNTLNFLDTKLNKLFRMFVCIYFRFGFQKTTFSGRYLNMSVASYMSKKRDDFGK